jgi:hypothetical protein
MLGSWVPLLSLALAGGGDELAAALARLSSPSGLERASAERWLGIHAERESYPELAAAAAAGGAEVRARLARALGSDARHFALAALFLGERDEGLASVGADALERLAARWTEGLHAPPATRGELRAHLAEIDQRRVPEHLVLAPAPALEVALEELARAGQLPLGWAVEDADAPRPTAASRGAWHEIVLSLADSAGLGVSGFGLERDPEERADARGFLLFAPTGGPPASGGEWIARWCRRLAGPPSAERARAARNLARLGWPGALSYLEELWVQRGDRDALEGLLCAAAQQRVVPALLSAQAIEPLLAEAERGIAAALEAGAGDGGARGAATRRLFALRALGCRGRSGEDLRPALVAGLDGASARGRWLRLAVLAGWGCALEEPDAIRRAALGPEAPRALARMGLAALASTRGASRRERLELDATPWLSALSADAVAGPGVAAAEWADLLAGAGYAPSAALRDPAPSAAWSAEGRLALFAWSLRVSDAQAAAAHLAALAVPPSGGVLADALARELESQAELGAAALAAETLQGARARPGDASSRAGLERVAALAGLASEESLQPLLARAFPAAGEAPDYPLLGMLGGRQDELGERARGTLVQSVGSEPLSAEARAAVQRISDRLHGRGADALAARFLDALSLRGRALASPWVLDLRAGLWPLPPRVDPRPLGAREPRLEPGEL